MSDWLRNLQDRLTVLDKEIQEKVRAREAEVDRQVAQKGGVPWKYPGFEKEYAPMIWGLVIWLVTLLALLFFHSFWLPWTTSQLPVVLIPIVVGFGLIESRPTKELVNYGKGRLLILIKLGLTIPMLVLGLWMVYHVIMA